MKTTITPNLIFRTFSRLQRSCFSAVFLMLFLLSASRITSDDGVVVTKKVLFPRTTLKIDKKIEVKSQLAEDE